jgi:peptidoglycan/xylan/chitin deacetylase (PgdA/CDA1 family)
VSPGYDANHDGVLDPEERPRIYADIPQFIVLSCDDNGSSEGLAWLDRLLKEHDIRAKTTFFMTANYLPGRPAYLGGPIEDLWALEARENYVGLHGTTHADGTSDWTVARWLDENKTSQEAIMKSAHPPEGWSWAGYPWGSRAPFLQLTDAYFESLDKLEPKVVYDSSLLVRPTTMQNPDVRDLPWPFTLDGDLPPEVERPYLTTTSTRARLGQHRIWEVPVYALLMETKGTATPWQPSLDFNLWKFYPCTGAGPNLAAVDVLERNLRAHMSGNRVPFTFGMHAQNYGNDKACERATTAAFLSRVDRLIEDGHNVRYISMPELIGWIDRRGHE